MSYRSRWGLVAALFVVGCGADEPYCHAEATHHASLTACGSPFNVDAYPVCVAEGVTCEAWHSTPGNISIDCCDPLGNEASYDEAWGCFNAEPRPCRDPDYPVGVCLYPE